MFKRQECQSEASDLKFVKSVFKEFKAFSRALRLVLWNKLLSRIPFSFIRLFFIRHYVLLGKGANVLTNVEILYSGMSKTQIKIGENSVINSFCLLDGRHNSIEIGKNVDIGRETAIFTLGHDPHNDQHNVIGAPVQIGDFVWIAARVTILPGVKIGRGAVVAAGSVVSKDVSPMEIVAGNPARTISIRRSALEYDTKFFPYLR
ncbi:MAG: acetyltransferase-like isoleucine patch superfamily enzyme [Paracoccaceae bacterium]|jgi:acetyltransferase-like isoleucine patch superfamily enzyme